MYNSKIKKTKKPNRGASLGKEEEHKVHIMKNKKNEETKISKVRFLTHFVIFSLSLFW